MTVFNIIGSNLEDVWGQDYTNTKKKKKSKRSSDAMCTKFDNIMDVYQPENEIYNEQYNKSRYSRSQRHLSDTDAEDRETEEHDIVVGSSNKYNLEDKNEKFSEFNEFLKNKHHQMLPREDKEKQYLDMSMYIFSGIAMIFIMEQFISIGIAIGSNI